MKYNNCWNSENPLYSGLRRGLENFNSKHYNFHVRKISPGEIILSYRKILRWKIVKDPWDRQLYIGYITSCEDMDIYPHIYVVTLRANIENISYVLERVKDNNLTNLKGFL